MNLSTLIRQVLAAAAVVFAATVLSRASGANAVTAGLLYFIAVLGLAVWQGFLSGVVGSLLATACFNYFFLPPLGTFHVADAQNWVALGCFLVATTVASRLVARERSRAEEAESRRREIAALYDLCVDLFTAGGKPGGLDAATSRALRTMGAEAGGLIVAPEGQADVETRAWIGAAKDLEVHRLLDRLPSATQTPASSSSRGWRNVHVPVVAGDRVAGILVAYGTNANQETLESVAKLIGLAFERERLLEERARLQALQASDSLKSALLRAVSHDLTTPLTAILLSLESLKRDVAGRPEGARSVDLIVEEATRLNRRLHNLLSMAKLEEGSVVPRREPTPPADLFRATRENLRLIASSRRIEVTVAPGCPDLDVDPSLALEILVNLIENAHRASAPSGSIELSAAPAPGDPSRVRIEVLDRGRGLVEVALRRAGADTRVTEMASGDVPRKGLGLEIARSFAAAHGSDVVLVPREGGGACARIDLPAAVSGAALSEEG